MTAMLDSEKTKEQLIAELEAMRNWIAELKVDETSQNQKDGRIQEDERLRVISDSTFDWEYWRAPDGSYVWNSPACERISGYSPEEFNGDVALMIHGMIHPEDKRIWQEHLEDVDRHTPEHRDLEFRIIKPSGEIVWINHKCKPIYGKDGEFLGRRGHNRDVSERKRTKEALQESEQRYRDLVEHAPIGIFRSTPQGRYLSANARLVEMYGYDSEQDLLESVQNIGAQMYVDPGERERVKRALEQGDLDRMEVRRRRKDGSVMWVSLSMRAVHDKDGNTIHYDGFSRDITKRKLAEELHEQIELIIRHDLRAPANNAIELARTLCEAENLTDEQRDLLGMLEWVGHNMLDALNGSLNLYKIETGQYQFNPEPFDCLAVIRELARSMEKQAQEHCRRLEILLGGNPITPDSHCFCLGESDLVRTSLQNLLVNALEASPFGGEVVVAMDLCPDCRIEIRNKGVVPAEIRDRFFDKFVTKGKAKGTGLGTYSAMMMIKAQGGDIDMRTSDGDNETVVAVKLLC